MPIKYVEEYRCKEPGCNKLLGKVDDKGVFHFESTRMLESFQIEKGIIICKNSREHHGVKDKIYEFTKEKITGFVKIKKKTE